MTTKKITYVLRRKNQNKHTPAVDVMLTATENYELLQFLIFKFKEKLQE